MRLLLLRRPATSLTPCAPVLLAAFLAAVVCGSAQGQGPAVVARASNVTGPALLANAGAPAGFPLTVGFVLNPGDRIDTRGGGRVVIDLSDGSVVVVQPQTVLIIKDFREASTLRELFDISVGLVRVKINHFVGKPNPYRMNSPTASIAVRGTEFTVDVADGGSTSVEVFEGAVEVSSLEDPARSALIEAGRGVLVQPGQEFRFYAPPQGAGVARMDRGPDGQRPDGNRERMQPPTGQGPPPSAGKPMQADNRVPPRGAHGGTGPMMAAAPRPDREREGNRPNPPQPALQRSASAYDRYVASLFDIGQVPYQYGFQAIPDRFSDSLSNPALAAGFTRAEARVLAVPSFGGNPREWSMDSAFTPQAAFFAPVGPLVVGAAHSTSRFSSGSGDIRTGSWNRFSSNSITLAGRIGDANSWGFSVERLRGLGELTGNTLTESLETSSSILQTRATLGFARTLPSNRRLGMYVRYGRFSATDADQSHFVRDQSVELRRNDLTGRSTEAGVRFGGEFNPRLSYNLSASWLRRTFEERAAGSRPGNRFDRGVASFGLGYRLDDKTLLYLDVTTAAGKLAQPLPLYGSGWSRAVSVHGAVQRDLWRGVFATASMFGVAGNTYWQPNRLSDFGVGYRLSPALSVQYVHSTTYGYAATAHSILLRYNLRFGRE